MAEGAPLSRYDRVELVWPDKDTTVSVEQTDDGSWKITQDPAVEQIFPFVNFTSYGEPTENGPSLLVVGPRLAAIKTLGRSIGPRVRFAYLDMPRVDVDDQSTAFRGGTTLVYSTWLNVLHCCLRDVRQVMRRDGVIAIHVGEGEIGFARALADEHFRGQNIGTIAWQKAYAPRNMRGMKEFTATHDYVLLYALDKDSLPAVGLRRAPKGFENSDGDPRGAWKAEHKGAKTRRDNSDFDTFQPPYRWKLISGSLPPGLWRISPFTGVIWGKPETAGKFPFEVEVEDQEGNRATRKIMMVIAARGATPEPPVIPWLFQQFKTTGSLSIQTKTLPDGVVGEPYSAILLAQGGTPYRGDPIRPGSGRYWEVAIATLYKAYREDAVYLGRKEPTAIPCPKTYAPPDGELVVENQQTWWPARVGGAESKGTFAGFTEDATKHLKALKELGIIQTEVPTAKPEHLMKRFIEIFTDTGDVVLEVLSTSADLAAVAAKTGRTFVALQGNSTRDRKLAEVCAIPRLRAVIEGKDIELEDKVTQRLGTESYIPYAGGGGFSVTQLGAWVIEHRRKEEVAVLNLGDYSDSVLLRQAVLGTNGFVPTKDGGEGVSFDGSRRAIALDPDDFLTPELLARIISESDSYRAKLAVIYFFRASPELDLGHLTGRVAVRRVPYDVI